MASSSLSSYFLRPKVGRIPDLKHSLAISHHFANLKVDSDPSTSSSSSLDDQSSTSHSDPASAPPSSNHGKPRSIGLSHLHFAREPEQQRLMGYGSISFPISSSSNPTLSESKTPLKQHLEETYHRIPFPNSKVSDLPNNDSWNKLNEHFNSGQKSKGKRKLVETTDELMNSRSRSNEDGTGGLKPRRIGPSSNKLGLRDIEQFTGIVLPEWWDGRNHQNDKRGNQDRSQNSQDQDDERGCFLVKTERRTSPMKSRTSSSTSNHQKQRIEGLIKSHFQGFFGGLEDSLKFVDRSERSKTPQRQPFKVQKYLKKSQSGSEREEDEFNRW